MGVTVHKFLRFHKRNHRTSRKMVSDAEYLKMAEESYRESINIAKSDGWNVEKEDKVNNVVVEMKKNKKGRKIYRCTAKIPMPARLLVENIVDTDRVTSWNTTLTEARVLKKISDTVAISYQITTGAAGGMVSARDFIFGGKSIEFKDGPKNGRIVRAINGPGCQMVRPCPEDPNSCIFVWLMDCEYKGMILQSILDIALPISQTTYVECIKKLGAKLRDEGKF